MCTVFKVGFGFQVLALLFSLWDFSPKALSPAMKTKLEIKRSAWIQSWSLRTGGTKCPGLPATHPACVYFPSVSINNLPFTFQMLDLDDELHGGPTEMPRPEFWDKLA